MLLSGTFLRFIRWPNLLFIVITQLLFYFVFLNKPGDLQTSGSGYAFLSYPLLIMIITASVLIAAAGYIINDYYDQQIDQINKPERVFIGNGISARAALLIYGLMSFAGLALSAWLSYLLHNPYILILNGLSVFLLYMYSRSFKRRLLIGNLIVSALTAWVILIFPVSGMNLSVINPFSEHPAGIFALLYGGFAFFFSMIREAVKDVEDVEGDKALGCTTLPALWGLSHAINYISILIIIAGIGVSIPVFIALYYGKWALGLYGFATIITPIIYMLKKLYIAANQHDFHHLSSIAKVIMLTGVLSMLFLLT